jgi:hypothetical protein
MASGPEAFPFFGPISLLFQAQGQSLAGRSRQAVIDMGTAVESLVTVSIREAMRIRGRSEDAITEVFEAKWKTVYNRSLLETVGVPVGAGGAAHSKRWSDAYRVRNDIVHKGVAVGAGEARRVVDRSWDFFEWAGERLRAQEDWPSLARRSGSGGRGRTPRLPTPLTRTAKGAVKGPKQGEKGLLLTLADLS